MPSQSIFLSLFLFHFVSVSFYSTVDFTIRQRKLQPSIQHLAYTRFSNTETNIYPIQYRNVSFHRRSRPRIRFFARSPKYIATLFERLHFEKTPRFRHRRRISGNRIHGVKAKSIRLQSRYHRKNGSPLDTDGQLTYAGVNKIKITGYLGKPDYNHVFCNRAPILHFTYKYKHTPRAYMGELRIGIGVKDLAHYSFHKASYISSTITEMIQKVNRLHSSLPH